MTARDVRDVILARLPAIGSPGERPFTDPDIDRERAWELIAREYIETLQQFDRTTLERAFGRVRDTNTTGFWPSPGRLRQAALALAPSIPDPDAGRRREADAQAEAYVSRFVRTSKLYREAKRDGWAGSLLDYVQSAAALQAQVLAGTRGVSWDRVLLDPDSSAEPREQIDALIRGWRDGGLAEVKVAVPKARIAVWRAAATERPAPAGDTPWQEVVARLTASAKRPGGPG
ncbi:hypothetical protein GobsT_14000 [Gemmata obscuriglobus]|uniref:Uncharacterized protein n=1 Tax=Gemmata obscuriglobus TaxID=114 RepID=A0A2Z3H712_9BACT|nr:hypothetical protein [Gemmata obscuriglobus]AWM40162.1 hypothetical protein C1280_26270 [Gemmata obscuriglobus]QEG26655.1 hypothetical protein GobsT_14000 [Gemmata obscuriglobus]VTS02253.1 unnamed protein product [Gemmata obscuriglobus UQM 2246]